MSPNRTTYCILIAVILLLSTTASISFEVPIEMASPVGETLGAWGVKIVDIDGDGDNDIIAIAVDEVAQVSLAVKMYESNGATPPSYTVRAVSPGGNFDFGRSVFYPKGLEIADINVDGSLDVISASSGKVSWHESNVVPGAITTFTKHDVHNDNFDVNGALGSDFLSVAVSDMNGDGRLDMVAANNTADEIWVFINEEDEGDPEEIVWTLIVAATGTLEPNMVAAADVNMDGAVDIIVADTETNRLLWLENDGGEGPVFTENEIANDVIGIRAVAVMDLTSDGQPEIVSASSGDDRVTLWTNGGGAAPVFTPTDMPLSIVAASSVIISDIDDDGDMDIVAGGKEEGDPLINDQLTWFDNDGTMPLSFTPYTIFGSWFPMQGLAAGDLDGDGDMDIASANDESNLVTYFENRKCSSVFLLKGLASTEAYGANAVHVADLNGDGIPDVLSSAFYNDPDPPIPSGQRRDITWYMNDGAVLPYLEEASTPIERNAERPQSVSTADFDDDGDLDVLVTSEVGNWIRWYENDGTGDPTFTAHTVDGAAFGARGSTAADLDGDGDMDIVAASSAENKVAWYENSGGPAPTFARHIITRAALGAWSVFAGDLDGDGDMDIASSSFSDGKTAWYMNDGASPPQFIPQVIEDLRDLWFTNGPISIFGADADGDNDMDLFVASVYDDGIVWWENTPALTPGGATIEFTTLHTIAVDPYFWMGEVPGGATDTDGSNSVFVTDVDSDGDMDVVNASALSHLVSWWENDGLPEPRFHAHIIDVNFGSRAAVAADLNSDGLVEIISASALGNSIQVYLNTVGDLCIDFDASLDGSIDAQELSRIGRAFGLIRDDESPEEAWWSTIDYDENGIVDGVDLAILSSTGVWGRSVLDCSYTCDD